MIELENDIAVKCDHCGEITYISGDIYDAEESYYDHAENGMGIETLAVIRDDFECSCCGQQISFELNASAYAGDIFNDTPHIIGGSFCKRR